MAPVVQESKHCSSAKEFLDKILSIGGKNNDRRWLFRGQGRDWPLLPSLFRAEASKKIRSLTNRNYEDDFQLWLTERDLFVDYFDMLDRRGLVIPDNSRTLRLYIESIRIKNYTGKFGVDAGFIASEEQCWPLLGLMQHYGVPTRLLDWSRQPLTAAFFSADGGAKIQSKSSNEKIVVWALHYPTLGVKTSSVKNSFSLRVIFVPSAPNPNLAAQQGVFTLMHPRHTEEEKGVYRALEDVFLNPHKMKFRRDAEFIVLRKITVPVSEAKEVLRLLERFDITPSFIYPGYQSIVDDIRNQIMWERQ